MESKPAIADRYGFAAKLTFGQSRRISLAMVDRLRVADGFSFIMLVVLVGCLLITTGGKLRFRCLVTMGGNENMRQGFAA